LDVGFVGSSYSGTSTTINAAGTNGVSTAGNVLQKQSTAAFGQSAETTSRIGFKGSEDLGGGMSALFTVELGLAPMNQETTMVGSSTTGSGAQGLLSYNRQEFVGLNKKGLGTVSIGTQYTPVFDVQAATDTAGNNNLVGNAVYSGSLQSATGTFNNGQGPYVGSNSVSADNGAYTTRAANALKLQSDRFAGFAGQLYYAQSNQNSTQTGVAYTAAAGGVQNNTAWGVNGDYKWNKLQVVAAYQNFRSVDQNVAVAFTGGTTATGTAASNGTAGGATTSFGLNATDNQTYAAAAYDFGILKAVYQYSARKVSSVVDSSYFTKRSANQIGVRSQLTPTISAYATYGLVNSAYFGNAATTQGANGRTYQLGVDYYLSKRTNLYGALGGVNQSSNGSVVSSAVATAASNGGVGTNATNYAVGIRHTF
jgi:predicted porin